MCVDKKHKHQSSLSHFYQNFSEQISKSREFYFDSSDMQTSENGCCWCWKLIFSFSLFPCTHPYKTHISKRRIIICHKKSTCVTVNLLLGVEKWKSALIREPCDRRDKRIIAVYIIIDKMHHRPCDCNLFKQPTVPLFYPSHSHLCFMFSMALTKIHKSGNLCVKKENKIWQQCEFISVVMFDVRKDVKKLLLNSNENLKKLNLNKTPTWTLKKM